MRIDLDVMPDGALKHCFAVENPQGPSALAVPLNWTRSGQPAAQVAQVQDDIVFTTFIFGRSISMGKGQELMGMVAMVCRLAKQHLDGQQP